uniref:Sushi domain-containing protein n=1 Tax=Branchiostoma floridae TaxID=7739 RepID=C3ZGE7_BRAFL|eukprot:XP_002592380.1 hypothetical protein BRAFLDRAFT_67241 [Branchiostoma floridae]
MGSGAIPDDSITASSIHNPDLAPHLGRLNGHAGGDGWGALVNTIGQWLQVFPGNTDSSTPVTNLLNYTVEARYVRFVVQSWHGHVAMRTEILGCNSTAVFPACPEELGMGSGAIPDGSITASSFHSAGLEPYRGRLNGVDGGGAWVAGINAIGQWLQVFPGNVDSTSLVKNLLDNPVGARYVRFVVQSFYGFPAMRGEILGCNISNEWLAPNVSWVVDSAGTPFAFNGVTYDAEKTLDGDNETWWNPRRTDFNYNNWYITLDLATPYTLTCIAVNNYGDTDHDIAAFMLQKSLFGHRYDWENVVTVTNVQGGTDQRQEFGGFQGTARYWRFVVTGTHSGHQPWIKELNVNGISSACSDPLGMGSGAIPDDSITASSFLGPNVEPYRGRLNGVAGIGGWIAEHNTIGQWLQIFPGNTDQDIPVMNLLDNPVDARYVRFVVQSWHNAIAMKVEILVCNTSVFEWLVQDSSWVRHSTGPPYVNNGVSYDAEKALDGNIGTYWNPPGRDLGSSVPWYIVLDFTAQILTGIAVNNYGDTAHDIAAFTLQKSQVGSPYDWEDVVSVTNVQGGTDRRQEFGGFRETARYWRFLITKTYSRWQPWLRELNFRGISFAECVDPPTQANTTGPVCDSPHLSGENCTYPCAPGYHVIPHDVIIRTCETNGSWTEPDLFCEAAVHQACPHLLGMESGAIPDDSITASSVSHVVNVEPYRGRLNGGGGWVAKYNTVGQWLQVFPGNVDWSLPVTNLLDTPVYARYVRFLPQSWHGQIAMRAEIVGCNTSQVNTTFCSATKHVENGTLTWDLVDVYSSPFIFEVKVNTSGSGSGLIYLYRWGDNTTENQDGYRVELRSGQSRIARNTKDEDITSSEEFRRFWICWSKGGSVGVGRAGEVEPFMNWTDPHPVTDIGRVGFGTWDVPGDFMFHCTRDGFPGVCVDPPTQANTTGPVCDCPYLMGENCTYPCSPGYHVTSGDTITRTCTANGSWTESDFFCQACGHPLGMESGAIPDGSVIASTFRYSESPHFDPYRARLNVIGGGNSWIPEFNIIGQWLQVFPGNDDGSTPVTNLLDNPVDARYVRFVVQSWGRNIAMRVEIVGCNSVGIAINGAVASLKWHRQSIDDSGGLQIKRADIFVTNAVHASFVRRHVLWVRTPSTHFVGQYVAVCLSQSSETVSILCRLRRVVAPKTVPSPKRYCRFVNYEMLADMAGTATIPTDPLHNFAYLHNSVQLLPCFKTLQTLAARRTEPFGGVVKVPQDLTKTMRRKSPFHQRTPNVIVIRPVQIESRLKERQFIPVVLGSPRADGPGCPEFLGLVRMNLTGTDGCPRPFSSTPRFVPS